MRIREQTIIDRPLTAVWPFVATAESFRAWNDKITHLEASGHFRLGQRFATHYALHERRGLPAAATPAAETWPGARSVARRRASGFTCSIPATPHRRETGP